MGKKKRSQNQGKSIEKSLKHSDVNNYEVTDSEEDMDDGEKMLLEKVRSHSKDKSKKKSYAIMDIPSSDDSDDGEDAVDGDDAFDYAGESDVDDADNNDDLNSDIEGQGSDSDGLPDEKAWGKRKKNYYNTDYVDADYGGFDGEDAEAADLEEQEAIAIQKRLTAELEGADFSLEVFTKKTLTKPETERESKTQETIKMDLSQLSSREKLNLLTKEAPELPVIVEEFQSTMSNVLNRLQKAANLVRKGLVESELLKVYIRSKLDISLNYAINVVFYLNLRARRIAVTSHPVVRRLLQYRDLLEKLKPLEEVAEKQIDKLFEQEAAGKLGPVSRPEKSKKKLDLVAILKDQKEKKSTAEEKMKAKKKQDVSVSWEDEMMSVGGGGGRRGRKEEDASDDDHVGLPTLSKDGAEEQEQTEEKRAITWQIAKNKGLTPRRKKEQRNPRVKHRNRFRKAKIRRKGQVREVRNEIQKYGGELSGIKSTVTKSIKFV